MNVMRAVREVRPQIPGLSETERWQLEQRLFADVVVHDVAFDDVDDVGDTPVAIPDQKSPLPGDRRWLRSTVAAVAVLLVVSVVVALATIDRDQGVAPTAGPGTVPIEPPAPSEPSAPSGDGQQSSSVPNDGDHLDVSVGTGPEFTELLVDPAPDGFELFSAVYQRSDLDGDVGVAYYRAPGSDVVFDLTVRSTPGFFDQLVDQGRQTWLVGDRVVVNDGELEQCVQDYCSVGIQWDDRTAISLAWAASIDATLDPEHTIERLVELAANLVEMPGSWTPGSLDPGSDTVHPELLRTTMNAALADLPTVTASATRPPNATTIEIDRGATHGLEVGMPVVDETGVIGKLAQVNDESSTVMPVIDAVYVVRARVDYGGSASFIAAAAGNDDSLLRLTPDPTDNGDPIAQPGTLVITQGGPNSLAPPGLPLGTLTTSVADTSPRVRPSANLDSPDLIQVVLYRPSIPGA